MNRALIAAGIALGLIATACSATDDTRPLRIATHASGPASFKSGAHVVRLSDGSEVVVDAERRLDRELMLSVAPGAMAMVQPTNSAV